MDADYFDYVLTISFEVWEKPITTGIRTLTDNFNAIAKELDKDYPNWSSFSIISVSGGYGSTEVKR